MNTLENNPTEKTQIWVRPHIYGRGVEVGIMKNVAAHSVTEPGGAEGKSTVYVGEKYYDAKLIWEEVQRGTAQLGNPSNLLLLQYDQAQDLMDKLWASGIRPAEARGSAGQLAAVEKHLADMRAIASHFLQTKLP